MAKSAEVSLCCAICYINYVSTPNKRFIHFHDFLSQIHKQLHTYQTSNIIDDNLIQKIMKNMSKSIDIIFIDELYITEIGDAMIISHAFEYLYHYNIPIVISSNRHPKDLYKDGVGKDSFNHFIHFVCEHYQIISLNHDTDYRRQKDRGDIQTFYLTDQIGYTELLDNIAQYLEVTFNFSQDTVMVNGRSLEFQHVYGDILVVDFADLCGEPLYSDDYIALTNRFNVIIMRNIPVLSSELRNEAKRFMSLIDHVYYNKLLFFCHSKEVPQNMYRIGHGSFEFDRTISRLQEMQSHDYIIYATKHFKSE